MDARFHKYRDLQGILHEAFPSGSQSGTFDLLLQLPRAGVATNPLEQIAQRWAAIFSEQHSVAASSRNHTSVPFFQTSVAPTFALLPTTSPRLRDLSPETDGPRTKGFLSKTTWLKGTFVTETEIANSMGGAGWLQGNIPGDNRTDASTRMVRSALPAPKASSATACRTGPPAKVLEPAGRSGSCDLGGMENKLGHDSQCYRTTLE